MYDEREYWNERLKDYGFVNTTKECGINNLENNLIKKYIKPESLILDFGVGDGRLFPLYEELNLKVQGYDIADFGDLIKERRKKYCNFNYHHFISEQNNDTLPYVDNNFISSIAFSVFPHQKPENIEFVIKEVMRVTKEHMICSVWNPLINIDTKIAGHNFVHNYDEIFKKLNLIVVENVRYNDISSIYIVKK